MGISSRDADAELSAPVSALVEMNDLAHGARVHFREIKPHRCEEFVRTGGKQRDFFPHRLFYLPKGGPDGFELAAHMCGQSKFDQIWEIVHFAHADLVRDLPVDLFFDPELIWHQQHFGRPGQVATANLVLRDARLFSMAHLSDLAQRISRRREHKTRIESRFGAGIRCS